MHRNKYYFMAESFKNDFEFFFNGHDGMLIDSDDTITENLLLYRASCIMDC